MPISPFRQIVSEALHQVTKIKKRGIKDKEKSMVRDKVMLKVKEEESNDSTSTADATDTDSVNVKIVIGM